MLTVQFDQRLGQFPQHITAHTAVIDPCGFATIAGVDAAQNNLAVLNLDACLVQHCPARMFGWQIKRSRDFTLFSASTNQFGTAPPAKDKAKTIKQNRFTRTSFTGQHI